MLGLPKNTAYATAKGGVVGLSRSLATAGARHDIKVNLIAPAAWTRMAAPSGASDADGAAGSEAEQMAPELVAPMVAFLAHETCPVTGQIYAAGAGRFARLFIASAPGYVHGGSAPTVEDVAAHWAAINAEDGYTVPHDLMEWSAAFLSHLQDGRA
jgi:NAD(P)-dependent dehydrogenase (short-subunit alcohol dehydrogenase family)